jgi:hypothetical protein
MGYFPPCGVVEPSIGVGLVALLGILGMLLAVWESRRILRFVRTRLVPAVRAVRLRVTTESYPSCASSRDLAPGASARVIGVALGTIPDRAVLSHRWEWGEIGETLDERTEGEDFSVQLSDGEVVRVGAAAAARRGQVRLLDGWVEERRGAGECSRRREILAGQAVAVSGQLERVIDEKVTAPHPRLMPTAWRLVATPGRPLIVEGPNHGPLRFPRVASDQPSGRVLALPAFGISVLMLAMSAPTAIGLGGVFPVLEHAGVSGLVFTAYLLAVGAPGSLRTWNRWYLATGFLGAAILGFWCGALV